MTISIFDCSEDAYRWILCTEKYFKERGTSEAEKMTIAATAMRDRARHWWLWWFHLNPESSWDTFTTAFLWRFKPEWRLILPVLDEEMEPDPDAINSAGAFSRNDVFITDLASIVIDEQKHMDPLSIPKKEQLRLPSREPCTPHAEITDSGSVTIQMLEHHSTGESFQGADNFIFHHGCASLFLCGNDATNRPPPPPPEPPDQSFSGEAPTSQDLQRSIRSTPEEKKFSNPTPRSPPPKPPDWSLPTSPPPSFQIDFKYCLHRFCRAKDEAQEDLDELTTQKDPGNYRFMISQIYRSSMFMHNLPVLLLSFPMSRLYSDLKTWHSLIPSLCVASRHNKALSLFPHYHLFDDCHKLYAQLSHMFDDPVFWNIVWYGFSRSSKYDVDVTRVFRKMHSSREGILNFVIVHASSELLFEHEAFYTTWLSCFVFPRRGFIKLFFLPIAINFARRNFIALAPTILASVCKDLGLLKKIIIGLTRYPEDCGKFSLEVTLHSPLVQIWVWERFKNLQPAPKWINHGDPALLKWHKVKALNIDNVRLALNSSIDDFLGGQYFRCADICYVVHPKAENWVTFNAELEKDLISFVPYLRESKLVGIDSIEQHLPHRISMQFGLHRDATDYVFRLCETATFTLENYSKSIFDRNLYFPSLRGTVSEVNQSEMVASPSYALAILDTFLAHLATHAVMRSGISNFCTVALALSDLRVKATGSILNFAHGHDVGLQGIALLMVLSHGSLSLSDSGPTSNSEFVHISADIEDNGVRAVFISDASNLTEIGHVYSPIIVLSPQVATSIVPNAVSYLNPIVVHAFLGHNWRNVTAGSNETLGELIVHSHGLLTNAYWYWICVGALLGYVFLFNSLFPLALHYLSPFRKEHTWLFVEKLLESNSYTAEDFFQLIATFSNFISLAHFHALINKFVFEPNTFRGTSFCVVASIGPQANIGMHLIFYQSYSTMGPPHKPLKVERLLQDFKAEVLLTWQQQHMLIFSASIIKGQQWDPGGLLDMTLAAKSSQFKQWDPGKFIQGSNFYNLEDKVDLDGVGNVMILNAQKNDDSPNSRRIMTQLF